MKPDALERRARNRAASDAMQATYGSLPRATREALKSEFADERARNDLITWARYLEVVLPRLPADAR